jgi:hypothetical protein
MGTEYWKIAERRDCRIAPGDRIAGRRAGKTVDEIENGDAEALGADLQIFGGSIHVAGGSRARAFHWAFFIPEPFSLPFLQSSNPATLQVLRRA